MIFSLYDSGSYRAWSFGMSILSADIKLVRDWTIAVPSLRLPGAYLLLNKSLLISVCFVVICIFPRTEIWPRNKNGGYLTEMLLFEEQGGMWTMSEDQVATCEELCPAWVSQDAGENKQETTIWLWKTTSVSHQKM